MSDLERIEAAMEEKVRPALRSHGGDISIDHVEGKTVYVKLLGQCAGCPSADLTNETIVEAELKAALPELVEKAVVVQTVSDELWEQAKKLLLTTSLPIAEVSEQSGYADYRVFTKVFKKSEGVTPSQYQRGQAASGLVQASSVDTGGR